MATRPLGIVIPTHNRSAALVECLAHLESQTYHDFEVVVVDDGSTDDTAEKIKNYQSVSSLSIRYLRQENSGPAKARNVAIAMLKSPLCLFLGDDIFASPTLVERHLQTHQEDPDIRVTALGLTRWSTKAQEVTPFMQWLDQANVQFSYPDLLAGASPDWRHFYTSNLSVKTELLRRFTFNEQFPYAAMEDMELAYRIEKQIGLVVRFLPEAVADHFHPTTFRQSCSRMVRAGYSAGLFYDLWPEQRPSPGRGLRQDMVEAIARNPLLLKLLTRAVDLTADRVCRNPFIPYILFAHFEVGIQSQLKNKKRLIPTSN